MANLKHITFTGIDEHTDARWLKDISRQFPKVEFGMLMAAEPTKHPNRYPNPKGRAANEFYDAAINGNPSFCLSAHLCGSLARNAAAGDWGPILHYCPDFYVFNRCQLNISRLSDVSCVKGIIYYSLNEMIIQQRDAGNCDLFLSIPDKEDISVLLDGSGGKGVYAEPAVLKGPYKVGYAGGLNAGNIRQYLETLLGNGDVGDFWVDMESGVRDEDDWLCPDKVEAVLKNIEDIL